MLQAKLINLVIAVFLLAGIAVAQVSVSNPRPAAKSSKHITAKAAKKASAKTRELNPEATVAVNPDAGVYHCEGSMSFKKYEQEKAVMTQKEATDRGYRAAFDKPCKQ